MKEASKTLKVSFEFFPLQDAGKLQTLSQTAGKLSRFSPAFYSVTYGAGGSVQNPSFDTVESLLQQNCGDIVPHVSCIGTTKASAEAFLSRCQELGIKRLVVLRGDLPSGSGYLSADFRYASDLVRFIREKTGDYFHLDVAVYPECHPEANSLSQDLTHFKIKVDSGANGAITQYFYHAEAYYYLLNECAKLNIQVPIVPGIMPITNFTQLARFSSRCGAEIPRWMTKVLETRAHDLDFIRKFGVEIVARLCEQLLSFGAPALHFYTLNKGEAVEKILETIVA